MARQAICKVHKIVWLIYEGHFFWYFRNLTPNGNLVI